MAEDFDEFGPWPGRGDWRGRAERIILWRGATAWEKQFCRELVREVEPPTEKQLHKLMTIWAQYLRALRRKEWP